MAPETSAVVVPGHSRGDRVTARCLRLLAVAAAAAEADTTRAVVFTGRSRSGANEAEQMRGAWPGRLDVELLVEPTARSTAENAARSLRLLLEREIGRATVVCAAHHALRVRYFFGALYERYGVACEVQPGRWSFSPGPLVHELGALTVMRRQRAAALSELRTAVRA